MVVSTPSVTAVSISPNPVNFSATFTVAVTITEVDVTLYPEIRPCGELYCGEE